MLLAALSTPARSVLVRPLDVFGLSFLLPAIQSCNRLRFCLFTTDLCSGEPWSGYQDLVYIQGQQRPKFLGCFFLPFRVALW
jgi:hypothetical protein